MQTRWAMTRNHECPNFFGRNVHKDASRDAVLKNAHTRKHFRNARLVAESAKWG